MSRERRGKPLIERLPSRAERLGHRPAHVAAHVVVHFSDSFFTTRRFSFSRFLCGLSFHPSTLRGLPLPCFSFRSFSCSRFSLRGFLLSFAHSHKFSLLAPIPPLPDYNFFLQIIPSIKMKILNWEGCLQLDFVYTKWLKPTPSKTKFSVILCIDTSQTPDFSIYLFVIFT